MASAPRLRASLIGAGRLLPKWDQLGLLLERVLQAREDERKTLDLALRRWIHIVANRSFVRATDGQRLEIARSLDLLRGRSPMGIWRDVAALCQATGFAGIPRRGCNVKISARRSAMPRT